MTAIADRLDLRLSVEDKNRLRRAAELHGLPVATFVREAALREAETTIAHPPKARRGGLAARPRDGAHGHRRDHAADPWRLTSPPRRRPEPGASWWTPTSCWTC